METTESTVSTKDTATTPNTESTSGGSLTSKELLVILLCIAFLAVPAFIFMKSFNSRTWEEYRQEQQQTLEHITEINQENLDSWKQEVWSEYQKDTHLALSDGSPAVERCHYTVVPQGDLDEAAQHISAMDPYEFGRTFSPLPQETRCETLPYDPVTGEVG